MKCIEVKKNLGAFVDGEIDSFEKSSFESHIKICISCAEELRGMEKTGEAIRQALPTVAPAVLDQKVLGTFKSHHAKQETSEKSDVVGWFGIPRFAFAAGLLFAALSSVLAFQIGKLSANNVEIGQSTVDRTNSTLSDQASDTNQFAKDENRKPVVTKIVEVPVVQERIVKVPAVREKVVTQKVYLKSTPSCRTLSGRTQEPFRDSASSSDSTNYQITSDINPKVINTKGGEDSFQVVPDLSPQIVKKGETNEK